MVLQPPLQLQDWFGDRGCALVVQYQPTSAADSTQQRQLNRVTHPYRKLTKGLFSQSDLPGAGKNIGRWLLPLALLENEDAKAYAAPIASILRAEPLVSCPGEIVSMHISKSAMQVV
jgi:hypothetical protein